MSGVSYQLYQGSTPVGSSITGTGGALDFGLQTAAGIYKVTATNGAGCSANMTGSATIAINPLPPPIGGPSAVCSGASITLTDVGGGIWSSSMPTIATIGSTTGVVSGIALGTTTITYTLPTSCFITTTVNVTTAPTPIVGPPTVCAGTTTTLSATPTGGTWISSNPTVATIGSNSGVVSGIIPGPTIITYSLGTGCNVTKTMTVVPGPGVITGTMSICAGTTTTLHDATTGGLWSNGSMGMAIIGSATGIVSGVTAGTETITYTAGGCSVTATVTVNAVPTIIGGPASVCVGGTITETNGVSGGVWSTTATTITIEGSTGIIVGVSAGTANITYALGSCTTTRTITINAAPNISGASGVCVGSTITLSASGTGTWGSGAITIATVGLSTGIVTGMSAGTAVITFTAGTGCIATKSVTVNTTPTVITGTMHVCQGETTTLSNGAGGGIWTSSNTSIATIGSLSGNVTGVTPGTVTISYSLGFSCMVTTTFTVNALPAAITGTGTMCVGSSIFLSDATAGGIWSSGATVAPVGSISGIVSGLSVGTETISYTANSCSTTTVVTVTPIPTAISGANHVCIGATTTLTDITTGGAWSSSNPLIATVGSASGVVTGISVGNMIITYSLGVGCTVTKLMTVDPLPSSIAGSSNICIGSSTVLTDASAGGVWSTGSGNVTVGSATGFVTGIIGGLATISYTIPTGCSATFGLTVVTVSPISGVHNICAWGDTMLIHDATPGGTFSSTSVTVTNLGSGDGIVLGHASGIATVTYTLTTLGCMAISTLSVNPLPGPITGAINICAGTTTTLGNTYPGGVWSSGSTTIATIGSATGLLSGLTGGTSNIAYTLPITGCKVDTVVTVSTFPSAGTISGAAMVCTGTSTTLTESVTGGIWSSSNTTAAITGGVVTGVSAGIDTIKYTVNNVCGTAQATKVIAINQTPNAGIISGADSICVGSIMLLSETIPGGIWSILHSNASVTAAGIVSGLGAGMDTVVYTVTANGCSAQAIYPVKILPLTDCGALNTYKGLQSTIGVFPNPNDGTFTIKGTMSLLNEDVSIEITDLLGRSIYRRTTITQNGELNETIQLNKTFARGTYLLGIKSGVETKVFHIVIE